MKNLFKINDGLIGKSLASRVKKLAIQKIIKAIAKKPSAYTFFSV